MHEEARLTAIDEYSRVVEGTDKAIVIGKGSAHLQRAGAGAQDRPGLCLVVSGWTAAAMLEGLGIPVVANP